MKVTKYIYWLAALVILSGAWDIGTFIRGKEYAAFEANPVYLLTQSVLVLVLLKFIVVTAFCWYLIKKMKLPRIKNIGRFAYVLLAVYLIVAQILAGVSNVRVTNMKPDISKAPEPQVLARAYFNFSFLVMFAPIAISLLAFWLYEKGFVKEDEENVFQQEERTRL
jgi:cytochrome bd-type quinol oxidase subunit 1